MHAVAILDKLAATLKQGRDSDSGLSSSGDGLGLGRAAKIHSPLDNSAKPVMQRNKALSSATGVAPNALEHKAAMAIKLALKLQTGGGPMRTAVNPMGAQKTLKLPNMATKAPAPVAKPATPAAKPVAPAAAKPVTVQTPPPAKPVVAASPVANQAKTTPAPAPMAQNPKMPAAKPATPAAAAGTPAAQNSGGGMNITKNDVSDLMTQWGKMQKVQNAGNYLNQGLQGTLQAFGGGYGQ